jgi:DNA-binding Lrp family transcriptional regulator
MPIAFVLINSEVGEEEDVLKKLKPMKGVREAHMIYGVYDIIAKIEAESLDEIREMVTRIRALDKVRSTLTAIVVKS